AMAIGHRSSVTAREPRAQAGMRTPPGCSGSPHSRKLLDHPMRAVKRLKVDNRRTRILTDAEQTALLAHCRRKLRAIVALALITGARIGELLALPWEACEDGFLTFLETKNGRSRRIP